MFCDLVGSTALSARFDPEDMREIIGAYHRCCAEQITKAAGFVAKYMGDGVLAYFGYPQAHEDDAERAVRGGLSLIAAVPSLRTGQDVVLEVRIGIATGVVVVGDLVGEGVAQEQGVIGETPNLAARLQALAEPGQVVISHSTRRLTGGMFEYRDLGRAVLKGLADPTQAWHVTGASTVASRFEAQHEAALTPLVGREEELEVLVRHWRQAAHGEGQVVLLSGEPGIGKSRLTVALQERLQDEPHTRLGYYCSPQHTDSAFHPVIAWLERAAGFARHDTPEAKLDKMTSLLGPSSAHESGIQLVAELLAIPTGHRYKPLNLSPQRKKEETLDVLLAQVEGLARRQPVLMVYEDVHWIDPSSRDLLDRIINRAARLPSLVIITFRPEFQPRWIGQAHVTALVLNRLCRREGLELAGKIAGNALSDEIVVEIVERTDGVPLFVEELTKAVVEAGPPDEAARTAVATAPLPALAVPATLHASLMARLDRLGPGAKEIAQIGAAIGREFSWDLLHVVTQSHESDLQAALNRLTEAQLVFRQGALPQATFLFKHALVRDAAYGSLLRSQRRDLHGRISLALETHFTEVGERQPEILARHLTDAGQTERAVEHWLKAGRYAAARSAHLEAIAHLKQGLELLGLLPDGTHRIAIESDLQLALGVSSFAAKGLASVEAARAYERARALCEASGDIVRLVSALWGLWHSNNNRNRLDEARALCNQLLTLTDTHSDGELRLQAQHAAWTTYFFRGEPIRSLGHCETGIGLYQRHLHQSHIQSHGGHDPGVCARMVSAWDQWMVGHSDKGLQCIGDALGLAEELAHPYSLLMALQFAAVFHFLRREPPLAALRLDAADALAAQHRLSLLLNSRVLRGVLALAENRPEVALANIRKGMEIGQASNLMRPYYLGLLAEALGAAGDQEGGLAVISDALSMAETSGERWWEAELCRLHGELLRSRREDEDSAVWFKRSRDVSQRQGAKALELRASTSLARLWRDQGKRTEARDLLAPVYGWFTEGFDAPDLKEAKALLEEVA
jgi:class 3 adenylate cyclase/predicted ATPase